MKNKTGLWIVLAILIVIFLVMYFKPAEPTAPIATVTDVVDVNEEENIDEDVVEEEEVEEKANEGEVEPIIPDAPLADVNDVEDFDDTMVAEGIRYNLVTGSEVEWIGKKAGGQHNGVVMVSEGTMYVEDGAIVEGRFVMDMTTIKATDIDNQGLDDHIKSWFATEQHPTAEFVITEVTSSQVNGVLTMNGQSKGISFPAVVIVEDETILANAEFALDTTLRGLEIDSPAVSKYMELSFGLTWMAQ